MKKLSTFSVFALAFIFSTQVVFAGYGTSPNINLAPKCNNDKPGDTFFTFVRKSGTNEIEVGWNQTQRATSWTIAYGPQSGQYIYGMSDFGDSNSRSVKINMLPVGAYYLVVKANNGCMPGNFSAERKMTVYSNGTVAGAKTFRLGSILGRSVTPTSTPTPTPTKIIEKSEDVVINTVIKSVESAPVERLNIFQRIWRFIFG